MKDEIKAEWRKNEEQKEGRKHVRNEEIEELNIERNK